MKQLISICGIDCEKCDARIATINNDDELRKKTAGYWSRLNNVEIPADAISCTGCRSDGIKTQFCESMCGLRKCATAKGYETCAECTEMKSCELRKSIVNFNPDADDNLIES